MNFLWRALVLLLVGFGPLVHGAAPPAPGGLQTLDLTVDGVVRTALLYVPPGAVTGGNNLPVVFVFHGHGGSSSHAAATFGINRLWPETITVYPQGLNTPGRLTDPEGKRTGWQGVIGDQGDRDLHFFDALLTRLKADYPVDVKRLYVTGHSNGGGFTFLLWLARPQVLAAVAPCSAAARYAGQLTPKPAMILAGRNDTLVQFAWQERMMDIVREVNGCEAMGRPWGDGGGGTLYPSSHGAPLVTFIYPGGHAMVPGEPALIVKFFQEQTGTSTGAAGRPTP